MTIREIMTAVAVLVLSYLSYKFIQFMRLTKEYEFSIKNIPEDYLKNTYYNDANSRMLIPRIYAYRKWNYGTPFPDWINDSDRNVKWWSMK